MNIKNVLFASMLLLTITGCSVTQAMDLAAVKDHSKLNSDNSTIQLFLGDKPLIVNLQGAISHLVTFYLKPSSGYTPLANRLSYKSPAEAISGFHYYGDKACTKETYGKNSGTLIKIEGSGIWIYTEQDCEQVHRGHIFYKGLYRGCKTFFPRSKKLAELVPYIQQAFNTSPMNIDIEPLFTLRESVKEYRVKTLYKDRINFEMIIKGSRYLEKIFCKTVYPLIADGDTIDFSLQKDIELLQATIHKKKEEVPVKQAELFDAITKLQKERVLELLEQENSRTLKDAQGNTALHYAVRAGWEELVLYLCNGELINEQNILEIKMGALHQQEHAAEQKKHETPLMQAIGRKQVSLVEVLVSFGADLDVYDAYGRTALMRACKEVSCDKKLSEIITILIKAGAGVDMQAPDGSTALIYAIENSNCDAIKDLLAAHDNYSLPRIKDSATKKQPQAQTALEIARHNGNKKIIILLENAIAAREQWFKEHSASNQDLTLAYACFHNDEHFVRRILRNGEALSPDVKNDVLHAKTSFGDTPLSYAVRNNNTLLVYWLLEAGANPLESFDENIIHRLTEYFPLACHEIHHRLQNAIEHRLAPLREIEEQRARELHQQREHEKQKVKPIIVQFSKDIENDHLTLSDDQYRQIAQCNLGNNRTPWFIAVQKRKLNIIRTLLDRGLNDGTEADKEDKNALMIALETNDCELVELLCGHTREIQHSAAAAASSTGTVKEKTMSDYFIARCINSVLPALMSTECARATTLLAQVRSLGLERIAHLRRECFMELVRTTLNASDSVKALFLLSHTLVSASDYDSRRCFITILKKGLLPLFNHFLQTDKHFATILDESDERGRTTLMVAAEHDRLECLQELLDSGADSTTCDREGKSALHYATADCAGYLRKHQETVQQQERERADRENMQKQEMQKLLHAETIRSEGGHALVVAAYLHDCNAIRTLKNEEKDPRQISKAYTFALMSSNRQVLEALIECFPIGNNQLLLYCAVTDAIKHGNSAALYRLLESYPYAVNCDGKGTTLDTQTWEMLEMLLQYDKGNTPLMCAFTHQKWEMAEMLLQKGALLLCANDEGVSALRIYRDLNAQRKIPRSSQIDAAVKSALTKEFDKVVMDIKNFKQLDVVYLGRISAGICRLSNEEKMRLVYAVARFDDPQALKMIFKILDFETKGEEIAGPTRGDLVTFFAREGLMNIFDSISGNDEIDEEALSVIIDLNPLFAARLINRADKKILVAPERQLHWLQMLMKHKEKELIKAFIKRFAIDVNKFCITAPDLLIPRSLSFEALFTQNTHALLTFLECGANANEVDQCHRSLLFEACAGGCSDSTKMLIAHGADVNYKLPAGCSTKIRDALLSLGVPEHKQHKAYDNHTPLMIAATKGYLGCVRLLLAALADLNIQRGDGATALIAACRQKQWDCVKALIDAGADVSLKDNDSKSALMYVITNAGKFSSSEFAVSGTSEFTVSNNACQEDKKVSLDIAQMLLEKGADVNEPLTENGLTLLMAVAQQDEIEFVTLLLQAKAQVRSTTKDGLTPLHYACLGDLNTCTPVTKNTLAIVQKLVEAGAEVNTLTSAHASALILFSERPQAERVMAYLLKKGAHIDARDSNGRTALFNACRGSRGNIKVLLDRGADRNAHDKDGRTALSIMLLEATVDNCAYLKEYKDHVEYLIDIAEVDCKSADKDGMTALHYAAYARRNEFVKYVLRKRDINVNALDHKNQTPLMLACIWGTQEAVKLLLADERCDINYTNSEKSNALRYALFYTKNTEEQNVSRVKSILNLLLSHKRFVMTSEDKLLLFFLCEKEPWKDVIAGLDNSNTAQKADIENISAYLDRFSSIYQKR